MRLRLYYIYIGVICLCFQSCKHSMASNVVNNRKIKSELPVIVGAKRVNTYSLWLKNKRVALLTNQTGIVDNVSSASFLMKNGIDVKFLLTPEHGLSGKAAPGAAVADGKDNETGLPVISLYNNGFAPPSAKEMQMFDVLLVDIQDVGTRFYTYYITMVRMMDVCAACHKQVIVLDRPNPNGYYVAGPVLDMKYKSGVGWLPIPVVYGLTMGELAFMTNGEHWLSANRKCDLRVVRCLNYTHHTRYELPVIPSPNLPNMRSVYLYPSLCLFEGTPMSVGRGTNKPFQCFGYKQVNYWKDLSRMTEDESMKVGFSLDYLIEAYHATHLGDKFFTSFFEKLIGVGYVRTMIEQGKTAKEISGKWKNNLDKYIKIRKKYLLYKN